MILQQVITAGGAFLATNVDDIVLLTLLLSRLPRLGSALPLMAGKLIGFSLLVLISLIGLLGRSLLPHGGLALLGLLPISLGISRWLQNRRSSATTAADGDGDSHQPTLSGGGPMAELLGMAALTLANGSDNIGVYLPLFAHAGQGELVITLTTFASGVILLCTMAWQLTRSPTLAPLLERYCDPLVPFVLVSLGVLILLDHRQPPAAPLAILVVLIVAALFDGWQLRPGGANQPERRDPDWPSASLRLPWSGGLGPWAGTQTQTEPSPQAPSVPRPPPP